MEALINWISAYANYAHWFIFGAIILAGVNIPISADIIILAAAFIAATLVPENTLYLYLAVFLGCYFSAFAAYWLGRLAGNKLCSYSWFAKFFPPKRLEKTKQFYAKYGFWALLIGRFIPFGVRNCIFMTSGMSRLPFGKFALWDLPACFIWSSFYFFLFYLIGQNYAVVYGYLKAFHLLIFAAFSVTLIGFIWYKRRKKLLANVDSL